MVVGYGVSVPSGSLPVFSVDTEEEAKLLVVSACPFEPGVGYYARELADDQTLENLQAFSVRLATLWFDRMKREPERVQARARRKA